MPHCTNLYKSLKEMLSQHIVFFKKCTPQEKWAANCDYSFTFIRQYQHKRMLHFRCRRNSTIYLFLL